jgi:drug/metabolite transporter (DMT)-like permease
MTVLAWILLCLIWGSTWIVIKIGLDDLPPITFAACRFILAGAILAAIVFARKLPLPKTSRQWRLMAVTGLLQFTINYATVFWSEQYIPSGLAAVLQTTIPVFGLILAWKLLPQEKITPLKVAAVFAGIVGVAIIFIDQLAVQNMLAFLASVAIVAGALAAAYASILIKAKGSGIDPAVIVFTQILFGLPPILAYALIAEGSLLDHNWSRKAVLSVLYLSVVGTIAAFWLYYWLLNRIESTKAMIISLVTPLIAVAIGAAVLGEKLTPRALAGGALVMLATGLIVYRRRTKIQPVEG